MIVFGVIGALLLAQFPEFFQQYTQRLGGRLDEVKRQVAALEQRAVRSGRDLPGYIDRFRTSDDPYMRLEGEHMEQLLVRRVRLAEAYVALTGADAWWRAPRFFVHFDWEVAASTTEAYRPGMPVTPEAAVYAGVGFLLGDMLFLLLPRRRRERKAPPGA